MSQLWTIVDQTSGAVLYAAYATPSAGSHPKDNGWAWDGAKQRCVKIDRTPDLSAQTFDGAVWIDSPTKVKADLVTAVKVEAERRKMLVRSPGSGKGAEYRQKRTEALAAANVLASVLNGLTAAEALKQYPAAWTEARLTGDKLAVVLARYLAASNAADAENNRLAAIEWAGKAAISAAVTGAAARAAYAAIDWTWKPA